MCGCALISLSSGMTEAGRLATARRSRRWDGQLLAPGRILYGRADVNQYALVR